MSKVQLHNLSKRYENGFLAVAGLTIDIEPGEFIALLGPSGCGKTTTLRMVAGLEDITDGDLLIDGVRVNERPPRDRDVAMVFQSYALYPHMTVFDNMAFGLRIRKLPETEIKARVAQAAASLGLEAMLDRRPGQMSGGQRQRVAMGRAIVRQPKVFLFDEPLSNLDARLRAQMRVELSRLHRAQGATSLYVTHDQIEAMTLADRVVLLKDGEVQQIGAPMALYEEPANAFVASFMGHPTMNLLPARLEGGGVWIRDLCVDPDRTVGAHDSIQLGIRPQDIEIVEAGEGTFAFVVDFVEPTGHETVLHLNRDGLLIKAVIHGLMRPRAGETVHIRFDRERLHLFSDKDGRRL